MTTTYTPTRAKWAWQIWAGDTLYGSPVWQVLEPQDGYVIITVDGRTHTARRGEYLPVGESHCIDCGQLASTLLGVAVGADAYHWLTLCLSHATQRTDTVDEQTFTEIDATYAGPFL